MLKTWKQRLCFAALVGVAFTFGCLDFGDALNNCIEKDHCKAPTPDCERNNDPDPPDDAFVDSNCDGVDGVLEQGLFVDPVGGDDTDEGTRERPLKTIRAAMELLRADAGAGITTLYLAQGTYDEDQIVVDRPVSLQGSYGGLSREWQRKREYLTHLDAGPTGLAVMGLGEGSGVKVEWVTITSANATTPGSASIAMRVLGTRGLVLNNTTLVAGQGGAGEPGANGDAGTNGPDGGAGFPGTGVEPGNGGGAPLHRCGEANHSGGSGRSGGRFGAGSMGNPGNPDGGTRGGIAGTQGTAQPQGQLSYYCEAGHGQEGTAGSSGSAGDAGPSGSGLGEVRGGTWVPSPQGRGGAGSPGTAGAGGGGGGSGGACEEGQAGNTPPTNQAGGGGGSGGGGGGGCGGQEGQGGGAGGASIALLLIDSTIQAGNITLNTRGAGHGGPGGEGGNGGQGGLGGPGADGGAILSGSLYNDKNYTSFGGKGAKGGNGGNGGHGGHGGGGAGGPSVGVWCSNGGVFTTEGVTITERLGPAGDGGTSAANAGAGGQVIRYQSCEPSPQ
jgi:hypothetical protein